MWQLKDNQGVHSHSTHPCPPRRIARLIIDSHSLQDLVFALGDSDSAFAAASALNEAARALLLLSEVGDEGRDAVARAFADAPTLTKLAWRLRQCGDAAVVLLRLRAIRVGLECCAPDEVAVDEHFDALFYEFIALQVRWLKISCLPHLEYTIHFFFSF